MTHPGEDLPKDKVGEKCPTCASGKPDLHPAVQFEGEVQPCHDPWHRSTQLGVEAWNRLPATLRCVAPGAERDAMERPLREARARMADAQRIAEMDAWIEWAEPLVSEFPRNTETDGETTHAIYRGRRKHDQPFRCECGRGFDSRTEAVWHMQDAVR